MKFFFQIPSFLFLLFASNHQFSVQAQLTNSATLQNNASLSLFTGFLDRVGISPTIGLTVFAPNNDAWNSFKAEDEVAYTKYTTQPEFFVQLHHLLLWHLVTEGAFLTDEIFDGSRELLETTFSNISISQRFKTISNVSSVSIVAPNISTSEGVMHIFDQILIPPYMAVNLMEHMLERDLSLKFDYTTMANLALYADLDGKIDEMYEHGLTFLIPPNQRFNRAQINVPKLLTPEMKEYTKDFVLAHMIKDIYYEAGVFAFNNENEQEQFLVKSELGTHMWITTTAGRLRFQSRELLVMDQPARNGIFHVLDLPVYPPFISDFAEFTAVSTTWDTTDCHRFFRQSLLKSEDISVMFNSSLTFFCPSREAFALFNNEDFQRLLEPIWVRHATEFLLNMFTTPAMTRADLVAKAPAMITMLNGHQYELKRSGDRPRIKNTEAEQGRSDFGDLIALDGYLHMLDVAITPTAVSMSVYDQCNSNSDFSLLVENIDFVQLTDLVDRDSPLTLLAPDNTAFRRVTFGTMDGADIVRRHIFAGLLFCDVIANSTEIKTVDDEMIAVELRGEPGSGLWGLNGGQHLVVGQAYVYTCDQYARNGVLHYVDRVIGLPFDTVSPTVSPAPTITAEPTIYTPPTTAPAEIPAVTNEVSPIALPPVLPGVVPSATTDDSSPVTSTTSPGTDKSAASGPLGVFLPFVVMAVGFSWLF